MSNDDDVKDTDPTGRYVRFDDELGRGAYKVVYRAIDRDRGVEVAWNQIKVDQRADFDKLWKEITILQSLSHPNILVCHAAWVDEKQLHVAFITECMTSGTIRQFMKKAKSVKLKVIKNWCSQILSGLDYLHTRVPPIIHRDIKCDNILINGTSGVVKIGDLGLATNILNYTGTKLSIIGTPEFMAPEYYEEVYDEKVDIWAFGMCLLEMATLEYPFSECTNPAQIFKKVSGGQLPRSLLKLKDVDIIQFLLECFSPAAQRKSASELLHHSFLMSVDDDRNLQLRTDEEAEELLRNGVTPTSLANSAPILASPNTARGSQNSTSHTTGVPALPSVLNGGTAINGTQVLINHQQLSELSFPFHGHSGMSAPSSPPSVPSAPISIPGRKEDITNHMEYTTASLTTPALKSTVSTMSSSMGDSDRSLSVDSPPMSLTSALPMPDHLVSTRTPISGHLSPPQVLSPATTSTQSPPHAAPKNLPTPYPSNDSVTSTYRHPPASYQSQIPPIHLGPGQNDMIITVLNTPQSNTDPLIVSLQLVFGVTGIVEFDFRIDSDTALDVAAEMSAEFNLSPALLNAIATYISDKVSEYIRIMHPEMQIVGMAAPDVPLTQQRISSQNGLLSPPSTSSQSGTSPRRFVSNMNLDRLLSAQLAGSRELPIDRTGSTPTGFPSLFLPSSSDPNNKHRGSVPIGTHKDSESVDDLALPSPRRGGFPTPLKRAYSSAVTSDQAHQLQEQLQHHLQLHDPHGQLEQQLVKHDQLPDPRFMPDSIVTNGSPQSPKNLFMDSRPHHPPAGYEGNWGTGLSTSPLSRAGGSRTRSASAAPPRKPVPPSLDFYQNPHRHSEQLSPSTDRALDDMVLVGSPARPASISIEPRAPHLGTILHEISADMHKNSGYFESALRDFEENKVHLDEATTIEVAEHPLHGHYSDEEDEEPGHYSQEHHSHSVHRSSPIGIGPSGSFAPDHAGSLSIPTPFGEVVIAAPHSSSPALSSPISSTRGSLTLVPNFPSQMLAESPS